MVILLSWLSLMWVQNIQELNEPATMVFPDYAPKGASFSLLIIPLGLRMDVLGRRLRRPAGLVFSEAKISAGDIFR